jgi:hypothetical protein
MLVLAAALVPAGRTSAAAASSVPDNAPVYFDFKAQDVPKYDGVVVTVCGLSFADLEKAILDRLFAHDAQKMAIAAPKLDKQQLALTADSKTDNAYLEDSLTKMLATSGKHYMVVPLRWSRNVEDTVAAEAQLQLWLPKVYAATSANKKPLYLFCHSWGTVLMHHVLTALAAQGSPVHVDKFITLGSPLVPSDGLIKLFDGMELPAQDFGSQATKPANVASWENFWGERDIFSNAIPAAGLNYRVDGGADRDELLLDLACLDPLKYVAAVADLVTMDNFALWHASYYAGYNQFFSVLKTQLSLDIPDAEVMPNAF